MTTDEVNDDVVVAADTVAFSERDAFFMRRCLQLADEAAAAGEVPVGAVVVDDESGEIVGEGRNRRESDHDPLAHAEVLAIAAAAKHLQRWRLSRTTLYVSLEPCFMCAGALVNARVDRLVFGAFDAKAGAVGSLANVCADHRLNHRLQVHTGLLADDCSAVLKAFFKARRKKPTTTSSPTEPA
ncbi:MAG TPA: tRNA adenosine(34) deaminase TadA [Myxococcota bacterium]